MPRHGPSSNPAWKALYPGVLNFQRDSGSTACLPGRRRALNWHGSRELHRTAARDLQRPWDFNDVLGRDVHNSVWFLARFSREKTLCAAPPCHKRVKHTGLVPASGCLALRAQLQAGGILGHRDFQLVTVRAHDVVAVIQQHRSMRAPFVSWNHFSNVTHEHHTNMLGGVEGWYTSTSKVGYPPLSQRSPLAPKPPTLPYKPTELLRPASLPAPSGCAPSGPASFPGSRPAERRRSRPRAVRPW